MLKQIVPALSGALVWGLIVTGSTKAATFSVTPSNITADSPGDVTLAVGGLTSHQALLIEQFADSNGNGSLDSGELLLLSFSVTDGEVPLFGGVRDTNRPGDEDGLTNGQVRVVLTLPPLPERSRVIGKYIFKISPADASFAPIKQPFEIVAVDYPQAVRGTVMSRGTLIANAAVVLLSMNDDDMEFAGGVQANGSGQFVIKAPPGDYGIVAFKDGFVADVQNGAFVSLAGGVDTVQVVTLLPADRVLSGRIFDSISSNGIAAVQLFLQSSDGLLTLCMTDADGEFSVPVTAGEWEIEMSEKSAALLGYGKDKVFADATGGEVTGIDIPLTRARGGFELVFFFVSGSFGSGTNGTIQFPTRLDNYYALYNVQDSGVPTNVFFTGPAGSGLNNTASAVFGANFDGDSAFYSSPQIHVPAYPPGGTYVVNYKSEPQEFLLADPQAQARQVILQPTVAVDNASQIQSMAWTCRDTAGNTIAMPAFVSRIEIRIDGIGGRLYNAEIAPDQTVHFLNGPVVWTNVSSVQMVYDDTLGNQYVSFWNRGEQPLQIISHSLPGGRVGVAYDQLFVAAGGRSPYSWSFVSGNLPGGMSFTPVTGELLGTPTGSGTFSFNIRVTDAVGQTIESTFELVVGSGSPMPSLEPMPMAPGQFNVRCSTEPGRSYSLQYSVNLTDWFTLLVTNAVGGSVDFHDLTATNQARFYRTVRNP